MIRPGDQPIPGYRVEKRLGSGQYGEVWRATSPGGTSVALKFLDMTGRAGWKEFRAIQRVKQIRHAHLMPLVALWLLDDEGQVLSDDAVENLAGETPDAARTLSAETLQEHRPPAQMVIATLLGDCSLRDRLQLAIDQGEPGVPVDALLGYIEEAAKGIDYLNTVQHSWAGGQVGVQHCDIKPDNILLTGGSAVVCDFGVAQVLAEDEQDNRATSLSGSPAYMSPESFRAEPSAASDQYALAVTYYELRSGRLPIEEGNFAAAYEAHQQGHLDFSAVSVAEQTVLKKATSPEPASRYRSSTEMVHALREAVRPGREAVAVDRRPAWHWYAAAGLAVLAALVAGLRLADDGQETLADDREPTVAMTLAFNATEIPLVVNGRSHQVDANGLLKLSVRADVPLEIEFPGNNERRAMHWTVPAEQVAAQSRHEFALTYTAAALAKEAESLLAEGRTTLAARAYAGAVEQAPEEYARLPEARVVRAAGLLWPSCLELLPAADAIVTGHRDGVVRRWTLNGEGIAPEPVELYRHGDQAVVDLAVIQHHVFSADERGAVGWTRGGPGETSAGGDAHQGDEPVQRVELIPGDGLSRAIAGTGDDAWLVVATTEDFQTRVAAWPIVSLNDRPEPTPLGDQPGEFPRLTTTVGPTAALATIDRRALLWHWSVDPPGGEPLGGQQNEILALASAGNLERVAYGGVRGDGGDGADGGADGGAALVDVPTKRRYPLAGSQSDSILAVALDQTGELLATAERVSELNPVGQVILWRADQGTGAAIVDNTLQYDKGLGDVTALAVASAGQWIAAGHDRGAVSIWQRSDAPGPTSKPVLTFGEGERIEAMAITGDGRRLIAAGHDGRLMSLDLARLEMILAACRQMKVAPRETRDRST